MDSPGFTPDFVNYIKDLKNKIDNIALPTSVPANVATKTDIADAIAPLAKKSEIPDVSNLATKTEIPDVSNLAKKTEVPTVGSSIPPAETATGMADPTGNVAAPQTHSHPRLSEVFTGLTTNATTGTYTISFAKTYATKPGVAIVSVGANAAVFWDVSYIKTGTNYTGLTITGRKGQALPVLTALLTNLVSLLSGFNPFSQLATNQEFSCIILKS
jgi:hypothetical protein